jgi:hypothetical protein
MRKIHVCLGHPSKLAGVVQQNWISMDAMGILKVGFLSDQGALRLVQTLI